MTLFIPPHDIATLFSHPISYIQYILPKQPLFKTQNFNAAPLDHYQIPVYVLPKKHSLPKQPYILPKQPYILPNHPCIPPTKLLKAECLASRSLQGATRSLFINFQKSPVFCQRALDSTKKVLILCSKLNA